MCLYIYFVYSVLPGPENWSRLHFQHQGVFKRMLVLESGGKLCQCVVCQVLYSEACFVEIHWAHSAVISCLLQDVNTLLLLLWSAYPAGICFPLTSMWSETYKQTCCHSLPLISQEVKCWPAWLHCLFSNWYNLVLNSIYFLVNKFSPACTRDLMVSFAAGQKSPKQCCFAQCIP